MCEHSNHEHLDENKIWSTDKFIKWYNLNAVLLMLANLEIVEDNSQEDLDEKIDAYLDIGNEKHVPIQFRCLSYRKWHYRPGLENVLYMRLYSSYMESELFKMKAKYFIYIVVDGDSIIKWYILKVQPFQELLNKVPNGYCVYNLNEVSYTNETRDDYREIIKEGYPPLYYLGTTPADKKNDNDHNIFIRIPVKKEKDKHRWSVEEHAPDLLYAQKGFLD